MKPVLAIAGTDPTGGAGIQTDLKTIEAYGLYGMAVITVVIAQNTTGVFDINLFPMLLKRARRFLWWKKTCRHLRM